VATKTVPTQPLTLRELLEYLGMSFFDNTSTFLDSNNVLDKPVQTMDTDMTCTMDIADVLYDSAAVSFVIADLSFEDEDSQEPPRTPAAPKQYPINVNEYSPIEIEAA
jgi:hypothetical protein